MKVENKTFGYVKGNLKVKNDGSLEVEPTKELQTQWQSNGDKPQFDTWLLHLPPINLYNVELVYLAFGYRNDVRSELDTKYELRDVESLSTTTRK